MTGERVFQMLARIVENWDSIPVRVYQDGSWQNLYLSEIKDDAAVAKSVISWLQTTYNVKEEENG